MWLGKEPVTDSIILLHTDQGLYNTNHSAQCVRYVVYLKGKLISEIDQYIVLRD
jgi:hypothetical protein